MECQGYKSNHTTSSGATVSSSTQSFTNRILEVTNGWGDPPFNAGQSKGRRAHLVYEPSLALISWANLPGDFEVRHWLPTHPSLSAHECVPWIQSQHDRFWFAIQSPAERLRHRIIYPFRGRRGTPIRVEPGSQLVRPRRSTFMNLPRPRPTSSQRRNTGLSAIRPRLLTLRLRCCVGGSRQARSSQDNAIETVRVDSYVPPPTRSACFPLMS